MSLFSAARLGSIGIGLFFISAGVSHFTNRKAFVGMMKGMPFQRFHNLAVELSGVMEIGFGLWSIVQPQAFLYELLIGFILCVSLANINMYVNDVPFGKTKFTYGLFGTHMARAVAQVVILFVLYRLRLSFP